MMKLTKKLFIASLSVAMVCSLFAGAFSFNGNSVKADESPAGAITYKLSEELSKIGYTEEEKTASGWDGKTSNAQKRSLFEIAYKKSAIEIYSAGTNASISPKYVPKQYYEWAGDGNAWLFSWTNAVGLSSGSNMGSNVQINKSGTHVIYTGSNGLVWAFAVVAPEKGTITIPEHNLRVGAHYSSAKALQIGFSKHSAVPSSFDPTNSALNMVSYEAIGDYTIAEQTFEVEAGDRVFITLYSDTQGALVSDARTTITYDPSFVFNKYVEPQEPEQVVLDFTLAEEVSKVVYTDEDKATAGWGGTKEEIEAREVLNKLALAKSSLKYYGAISDKTLTSSSVYTVKEYWDYSNDSKRAAFSYSAINDAQAGHWLGKDYGLKSSGRIKVGAQNYSNVWIIEWTAPQAGVLTIDETPLTIVQTSSAVLKLGYSKNAYSLPTDANPSWSTYSANATVPMQEFSVAAGDKIYISMYADNIEGSNVTNRFVTFDFNPSFHFVSTAGEKPEITEETVSLNSEVAKITLTDAELAAAGWDGTTPRTAGKEAALKTAFGKSAIKFYTASGYTGQNYAQKEYYKWSNTDWDWLFSYTKVNELGAGNAVPNKDNPRFTSNGTHMLFSRNATYHIVWALGYVAPQDGVVTIPAHELILNYFTNTDGLYIGFSKGSANRATINPNDASLNFVKYTTTGTVAAPENKVISFEEQTFNVRKGEVVYINIYCNPTGSDARASVTWNPSFHFVAGEYVEPEIPEEPEEGVIQTTLGKEIGKIVITDEEKASTGWDGSLTASAAKEAAYKLAFEKSLLKFYAASNCAVDYRQMEYWDYAQDGNAWTMNYSGFSSLGANGGLSAGTQNYNPSQNLRWEADGVHNIYSRAVAYHITWAIGFEAPEDGKIIIPEHTLVIDKLTNASALHLGFSLGTASRAKIKPGDASLNCVAYTEAGTYVIAEQVFNVKKGDMVYLNVYCDATGNDARATVTYNPTFRFETDPCVLHGHTEVVDAAKAPTCTETGLTEGKHCSVCNEVLVAQEVVKALGHSGEAEEEGYAPTCTEPGLTDKMTCSVCGVSFEAEEIPALGHDVVNHEAKAPTCTEIGWDAYETCSRCDYSTYVEKAALGHDMAQATCTLPATCSVCGHTEGEALGHAVVNHEAKAPTCMEIGWDAYETCSRCDYSTYAEKAALGHDMAEATCVAPKTCKNGCGYTEGEALGHIEIVDEAVAPTCTETGLTEGKHCGRCEEVLVAQEVVAELGHDMAQATCTLPATCSVCGHTEGSALGHVWEAATCLLPSTCSTCGETKGEALGHDMAPATCTQPSTCVNGCGLTEGDVLEHVYGEWEVVKAPTHQEEGLQKKACVHCGDEIEEILPIDKNAGLVTCNGSIGGSGLFLLVAAVSGALIIRKKRG